MKRWQWAAITYLLLLASARPAAAQAPAQGDSAQLFTTSCAICHGNPGVKTAPDPETLRQMTAEAIYAALTTGVMRVQAQSLPDDTKRALTEYLAGRKPGLNETADAQAMPNRCSSNGPMDLLASPMWNGWGANFMNTRFQSAKNARLTAEEVPQLKLKWAFGFPGATTVYGQPTIAAGRIFLGLDTGYVYSLDAKTGCVYWSFQAQSAVRSAISIGPSKNQGSAKYTAYFGDMQGNAYALDAATGKLLWHTKVDNHAVARITGAPKLDGDILYVPVTSLEELTGANLSYPCCTFRGGVVALDASTGHQIWKTYSIAEEPKPVRTNSKGVQLWGPSGGAVWDSPTIDPKQHTLYIGTGDGYTGPSPATTDAVMALDLKTGKILWSMQGTANDNWIAACASPDIPENCPKPLGPDADFGASPILKDLPNGKRILVAAQKSGFVWSLDPDKKGAVVWKTRLAEAAPGTGEIMWGGAADNQYAYFGLHKGVVAAVRLTDGSRAWFAPLPPAPGTKIQGNDGALSGIPGVIFSDGWDGVTRALSTQDGKVLWQYNTVQEVTTVNGVAAKGGSMGSAGPTIAGGMLFVGSGYVGGGGMPGNVLLAFSAK